MLGYSDSSGGKRVPLESIPIYIYIEPRTRLRATMLFTGSQDTFVSFHLRHGTGRGYVLSAS